MSKRTVSRLFIGSLIAGIAGAILAIAAGGTAYANDVFVMSGNQITGVQWTPLAWSMLGLGIVGSLALVAAAIGGLVAWIGALLNTSQLESKTWFLVLLAAGHLQLRLLRDGGLRHRRSGWHSHRRTEHRAGPRLGTHSSGTDGQRARARTIGQPGPKRLAQHRS